MKIKCEKIIVGTMISLACTFAGASGEIDEIQEQCMVSALYHEARGEPKTGIYAVASVIINRTKHSRYRSNVCGVVHQRGQFTFDKKKPMRESAAIRKIQSIVDDFKQGMEPIRNYIYFHRYDWVGPCTNKKNKERIGSHLFCND